MRGLNLSALAARGRAAEGLYSARSQAAQASALRSKMSASELASLRSEASASEPTVDVLGSISGQSALARLALESARAKPTPVVRADALPSVLAAGRAAVPAFTDAATITAEPTMRALGANKFGLYQRIAAQPQPARTLPGSDRYAEGAVLGMASFSVATAIVGGIGAVGIGAMYLNPGIVEEMRGATRRARARMDDGFGARLRAFAERMRREDAVISKESIARAQRFARTAVKTRVAEDGAGEAGRERSS